MPVRWKLGKLKFLSAAHRLPSFGHKRGSSDKYSCPNVELILKEKVLRFEVSNTETRQLAAPSRLGSRRAPSRRMKKNGYRELLKGILTSSLCMPSKLQLRLNLIPCGRWTGVLILCESLHQITHDSMVRHTFHSQRSSSD